MFITVNGAKLYVDVEGAGLVPDGPHMREKPTLLLLHGGPGADHSGFKPAFSALSDSVQLVYVDHRGCGRSDECEPLSWNLTQWADDVKGLCDALGIEKPIVYGVSFGGMVAQAYACRYPQHPSKLILTSTAAKVNFDTMFAAFGRIGGPLAQEVAMGYWLNPNATSRARYFEVCLPLYQAKPNRDDWLQRTIVKNPVAFHFNGPHNELGRFDFRADLAKIRCPVLVLGGGLDPLLPMAFSEEIVACLPAGLGRLERFDDCGHGVVVDDPERALKLIREFVSGPGPS